MGTLLSDNLIERDTNLEVLDVREHSGKVRVAKGHAIATNTDIDASDIIKFVRLPMNAKIVSIKLYNDDCDSHACPTITANVGLYYGGNNGISVTNGAVIDIDCYATLITTLQAANTLGVEVAFEARDIVNHDNEIWQDGGLTSNPGGYADIAITIGTGAATEPASSDILMVVQYVVD